MGYTNQRGSMRHEISAAGLIGYSGSWRESTARRTIQGMQVGCPHCGFVMTDDGSLSGHMVLCGACRQLFQMPGAVATVRIAAVRPKSNTALIALGTAIASVFVLGGGAWYGLVVAPERTMHAEAERWLHEEMPADDWHVVKWWPAKGRPQEIGGGAVVRFIARGTNREGGKTRLDVALERLPDGTVAIKDTPDYWYDQVADIPALRAKEKVDSESRAAEQRQADILAAQRWEEKNAADNKHRAQEDAKFFGAANKMRAKRGLPPLGRQGASLGK